MTSSGPDRDEAICTAYHSSGQDRPGRGIRALNTVEGGLVQIASPVGSLRSRHRLPMTVTCDIIEYKYKNLFHSG
ncbi:MAG: hypothetical protein WD038_02020 [Balneolales bacterium]